MNINDDIKHLEKLARIKLTDEERKKFIPLLEEFKIEIENFKKLDLTNVEEARAPFLAVSKNGLRSDDIIENNPKSFLKESMNVEGDYIVLKEGK